MGLVVWLLLLCAMQSYAQTVPRIDPPHWFVNWSQGEHPFHSVELLIDSDSIVSVSGQSLYSRVVTHESTSSGHYHLATVEQDVDAPPHLLDLVLTYVGGSTDTVAFAFKAGQPGGNGLRTHDVLYLITPDRFANGDPANDVIPSMREHTIDRRNPSGRHGGDIAGLHKFHDHLTSLGISAVWLNPVLENDQSQASYHGYAVTDHYRVDPRFGTNDDYAEWVDRLHRDSMRVVMDVVLNHVGDQHRLFRSPPDSSWFHWWPSYTNTNFDVMSVFDSNTSCTARDTMLQGWFDRMMPDIDQRCVHAARYLLQNTVWWIREAGVDALRIDTYPYSYPEFMRWFNRTLHEAFPNLTVFGEIWVQSALDQHKFLGAQHSDLHHCTDFALYYGLNRLLSPEVSTRIGACSTIQAALRVNKLGNPDTEEWFGSRKSVAFLDNHDVGRIYGCANRDLRRWSMVMTVLFTLPRIPCLLYGTEFLFAATENHGLIREDVSGGWAEDRVSFFRRDHLSGDQQIAQKLIQDLVHFRRTSVLLQHADFKWMSFSQGCMVYTYTSMEGTLVVVSNLGEETVEFDLSPFTKDRIGGVDVLMKQNFGNVDRVTVEPSTTRILEFR
ncbi:MAG: alpha-amylase family glycosyl hydrolase [Candidatus Kapaibacteriota bacterium]